DYMLNEQLTCLTLFSQIDQPGLAWRTGVPQIKVTNAQRIRPASWAFRKRNWTPSALTLGTRMKVA
ncbi:MAG: hypothetical protein PHG20_11770, partial [Geobacteraceae bacterium]|nr:hypothetical protein [Geobacteraceae bacterium]